MTDDKHAHPRNSKGERICRQCLDPDKPLRESLGRKPVIHCSKLCTRRAYEERRRQKKAAASVPMR
ncbi:MULTISPECIES: hypothetical protein [unclassified Streptomyces]|uniref:hypothetical protein n=1 Tax=unclassified Streptomyces TaxID=2593676 RepID=UPI0013312236|nr:hypothetical protein [Streptomyces sp. 3211]